MAGGNVGRAALAGTAGGWGNYVGGDFWGGPLGGGLEAAVAGDNIWAGAGQGLASSWGTSAGQTYREWLLRRRTQTSSNNCGRSGLAAQLVVGGSLIIFTMMLVMEASPQMQESRARGFQALEEIISDLRVSYAKGKFGKPGSLENPLPLPSDAPGAHSEYGETSDPDPDPNKSKSPNFKNNWQKVLYVGAKLLELFTQGQGK